MQNKNADAAQNAKKFGQSSAVGELLTDKEKKSFLVSLSIGLILVELCVTVVAILYGVTNVERLEQGGINYIFPWVGYIISLFVAPIAVMFLAQMVGFCFSRLMGGEPDESTLHEHLPARLRRLLMMFKGLPTLILLGGMLFLGAVLFKLDAIMIALAGLGELAIKVALGVGIAVCVVWLVSYFVRMYFMYKTNTMQEEFAFRREVLERTGIAIIDKQTALTSDGQLVQTQKSLAASSISTVDTGKGRNLKSIAATSTVVKPVVKPVETTDITVIEDAEIVSDETSKADTTNK